MPKARIKKKVIKFRTPRTCTKTRGVPCCDYFNYPLTEEWEVALDDLCDLLIQMRNARDFLKEWVRGEDRSLETQQTSTRAIAAYRLDRALEYLLHVECELNGAFTMEQEYARDKFDEATKTRSAREYRAELLKEEDYESGKRRRR